MKHGWSCHDPASSQTSLEWGASSYSRNSTGACSVKHCLSLLTPFPPSFCFHELPLHNQIEAPRTLPQALAFQETRWTCHFIPQQRWETFFFFSWIHLSLWSVGIPAWKHFKSWGGTMASKFLQGVCKALPEEGRRAVHFMVKYAIARASEKTSGGQVSKPLPRADASESPGWVMEY